MKPEIRERIEKIRKGEVPEGYKKTTVGIIPLNWDVEKLSKFGDVVSGGTPDTEKRSYWGGDLVWVTPSDLSTLKSKFLFNSSKHITEEGLKNSSAKQLPKHSLIVCTRATIGTCVINKVECSTNQGFKNIILNNSDSVEYLYYQIQNNENNLKILGCGSTFLEVSKTDFGKFLIPSTNVKERQKIAEILSTWDKAIELKEKLITEKKEFKRGLTQRLLVGKLRFKEHVKNPNLQEVKKYGILPEEWGVKKASSIFSNISKKNNGNEQLLSATQNNGVIPRDMLDGDVMSPSGDTNSYKLVEEGDFVISLRSFQGGLEYSCYRGMVSPAYTVLKNKIPICKDFYRHLFKSKLFIDRLASSVIGIRDGKQISYEEFSIMLLPYPELKEQEKIASMLNNIDNNIEFIKLELNQLKEQKRGLMQLLLTGIVRVEVD